MMPPPGLHIYLRPRMTLNFDLLAAKLMVSCHFPLDHVCQCASQLGTTCLNFDVPASRLHDQVKSSQVVSLKILTDNAQ